MVFHQHKKSLSTAAVIRRICF